VAVAVASIVNILGDLALVPRLGLAGAAVATAAASVSSTLVLLKSIRRKTQEWKQNEKEATGTNGCGVIVNGINVNGINATMSSTTTVVDGKPVLCNNTMTKFTALLGSNNNTTSSTAVVVASDTTIRKSAIATIPFISLPDRVSFLQLVKLAGPIFFVIVGKVICYSAMTLKATSFGLSAVATHNIMMRVFFFHTTFGDSLNQAGQTFLPQTLLEKNTNKVKKLLKKFLVLATCIGVFNWISVQWMLHHCASVMFTNTNADIIRTMAETTNSSPVLAMASLFHPYIMVFEGSIIASGDLQYLVWTYVATMTILFAQLKFATPNFGGVWTALLLFQALRLVQFKMRVFSKVIFTKGKERT
jgi:Na+-driven multidrug efflux pump